MYSQKQFETAFDSAMIQWNRKHGVPEGLFWTTKEIYRSTVEFILQSTYRILEGGL